MRARNIFNMFIFSIGYEDIVEEKTVQEGWFVREDSAEEGQASSRSFGFGQEGNCSVEEVGSSECCQTSWS